MNRKQLRLTISAAVSAVLTLSMTISPSFAAPKDIQIHWSGTAVNTLMEKGILSEYPDGRFKPDRDITRGEAVAFLASYLKVTAPELTEKWMAQGSPVSFSDLASSDENAANVDLLTKMKIVSGYPEGTFRPEEFLSREAFSSMIYKLNETVKTAEREKARQEQNQEPQQGLGETGDAAKTQPQFSDISDSYARQAILGLAGEGVLNGYPDGTFRPQNDVTRGEAASVLYSLSGCAAQAPRDELPLSNVIEVPYISQINPYQAWKGCEATSLLMAMKGKGYLPDMTLKEFLDGMPMHESNPAKGFAGSPYEPGAAEAARTTIYPAKLAEYASAYGRVSDFSGSSVEELQAEVLAGNPVVAYVTLYWKNPVYKSYKIEDEYQYLVSNNHALLVCGYDRETNQYFVADPYNYKNWEEEYKYWVDAALFDPLYNVRKHALVVE